MLKLNEMPYVRRIRILLQAAFTINTVLGVIVVLIVAVSYYLRNVATAAQREIAFRDGLDLVLLAIVSVSLIISFIAIARLLPVVDKSLKRINGAVALIKNGKYTPGRAKWQDPGIAALFKNIDMLVVDLDNSRRIQKNLIAGIAHELNTPLTTMRGHVEGMADGTFAVTAGRLEILEAQIGLMQQLVCDLMDSSQAEAGTLRLQRAPVDINELLRRVFEFFEPLLQEKRLELICSLQKRTVWISADEQRLKQIFINLLTNAIRYSEPGGRVSVATEIRQLFGRCYQVVIIKDQGIGISTDDLPKIFDYFFRAKQSRNRDSGGRGIGLALVKQLVAIQGGRIFVRSALGVGSSFIVIFPTDSNNA